MKPLWRTLRSRVLEATPAKDRSALVDFKNKLWGGYKQTHYSQFGEDVIVGTILKNEKGFYVDIGANHPHRYSNTALLYKRGWRGINVDANPVSIQLFNTARPEDINIAVGIAKEPATLPYYQFSDPAMNTFSKEIADSLGAKTWLTLLSSEPAKLMPLCDVLDVHVPNGTHIDFMNIDVEGLDKEVLESNNWDLYKPTCIAVEAHDFSFAHADDNPIFRYLSQLGYTARAFTGTTLIFVQK